MKLFVTLLVSSIAAFQVASGAPVSYYPYRNNARYFSFPCVQQGYLCNQSVQTRPISSTFQTSVIRSPILKQVFTTVTRKHDNLNTAQTSNKKGIRIKHQDGPSVEAEGEHVTSVYSKASGGEHLFSPMLGQEQLSQHLPDNQFERMQPEQDALTMQPLNDQEQPDQVMPNTQSNSMQSEQPVEPDEDTEEEPEDD
ncbi:hypothetical protein K7432_004761 [Basidiobolus ranarum]|uniref:Uncharacterized protein n=1 Tax=Basidiobolus ranarum TaxID=34480 RepID=A0ABR2WXS2_9FUNG